MVRVREGSEEGVGCIDIGVECDGVESADDEHAGDGGEGGLAQVGHIVELAEGLGKNDDSATRNGGTRDVSHGYPPCDATTQIIASRLPNHTMTETTEGNACAHLP